MMETNAKPRDADKLMMPGDDMHMSALMAWHGLNLVVGEDRVALLAFARDVWKAAQAHKPNPTGIRIMALARAFRHATQEDSIAAHKELEDELYAALYAPSRAARLARKGMEATPHAQAAQVVATMDLVKRAADRMRELHQQLDAAHAHLERLQGAEPGSQPLAATHGTDAANVDQVQAAA